MHIKKPKIKILCSKCNKECPVDKEKSNKNWIVYKNIKTCECGGHYKIKIS